MVEGSGRPDEIITCEVRPDLVREARTHWAVENNPYQLWHRGYVAVKGGAMDCPYTFMHDMVNGRFRLPWEDEVVHVDGTSCGFAAPTRRTRRATCCPSRAERAQGSVTTRARSHADPSRDDVPHVVAADPYPWPYDGDLRPANTALVVIDMQTDFCGVGGYVDKMGYDLSLTRAPIEPIRRCMARCARSASTIIHTREGHRPDLADLPANKRWRSRRIGEGGRGIGDAGPVRPHPRARRAGLGDHPRARAAARRGRHRQARQGLVLRDRPRADPAHARHRAT